MTLTRLFSKKVLSLLICAATVFTSPSLFASADGSAIVSKNTSAPHYVALTFDDGPHATYTDKVLSILEKYGIKATFFMVGSNAEAMPETVKKVYDAGHEIGNHTYDHIYVTKHPRSYTKDQIEKTSGVISRITGERPKLFRPPGGICDKSAAEFIRSLGYECVLWSVDTRDWALPGVEKVVRTVVRETSGGDIILFHDFNRKGSPTPEALERIIPMLIEKGYSFVTVSELIAISEDKADPVGPEE